MRPSSSCVDPSKEITARIQPWTKIRSLTAFGNGPSLPSYAPWRFIASKNSLITVSGSMPSHQQLSECCALARYDKLIACDSGKNEKRPELFSGRVVKGSKRPSLVDSL